MGNRTRARVVKNKIAPPFRDAEFDIMFDRGISYEGDLIDLAALANVVEKTGAWYNYKSPRSARPRERQGFLVDNPELVFEIEGPSKRGGGQLSGRTRQNKLVHLESAPQPGSGARTGGTGATLRPGTYTLVEVTGAGAHSLRGELVEVVAAPRHRTRIPVAAL